MSKVINKKYKRIIQLLIQISQKVVDVLYEGRVQDCFLLLGECQETAITLGTHIEKNYGTSTKTVKALEQYCESLYGVSIVLEQLIKEDITREELNENRELKSIISTLEIVVNEMERVFHNELEHRLEVVFMPYKAAMWDSLESVWMAADADPNCDVYVVPIPYYDKTPIGSIGELHYEGDLFPQYVPITHYETYDIEERQPDVIYIHNPYDWANTVTSVDPRFYSDKLKEHTECLVYIPYYSTAGGMAESQEKCPAYYHADYIVIQSEKYRKFFDPALPDEKFLPFGSPKFDRVIRICDNPPEPPTEWKEQMTGKKLYFYNTSLGGMLADTEAFFKKMQYIFDCFKGREDACLLWRPHPLFESTIDSMRPSFRPVYEKLKTEFLENNLGIYDTTSDITNTIALCDAYLGDTATSVTSLFGVAGKPMFLLNNNIHALPEADDWKAGIIRGFTKYWGDEYKVAQGNKLYRAANGDYCYHYACDLHEYTGGGYYNYTVFPYKDRHYVCPVNAQDILVIQDGQIIEKIELVREVEHAGAFYSAVILGQFLYLIPNKYPAIVRLNCETGELQYIRGYNHIFVKCLEETGEWRFGPVLMRPDSDVLRIFSPTKDEVLVIDNAAGKVQVTSLGVSHDCGCLGGAYDGTDWWLFPYTGKTITRWNEKTGKIQEYSNFPADFACTKLPSGQRCEDLPFGSIFFHENDVYFAPRWGNMFLRLDKETGVIEKWEPFFPVPEKPKSVFYPNWTRSGSFDWSIKEPRNGTCRFFTPCDATLYELDFNSQTYQEVPIIYDVEELHRQEAGFSVESEWQRYGCWENAFNSLPDFLNDAISGNAFSREAQLRSFAEVNASCDGMCGQRVHEQIKAMLID